MDTNKIFKVAAVAIVLTVLSNNAVSAVITPTGAYGWPNERTSGNRPVYAIDGDLDTFTWTTESNNTSTAHLGLDFSGIHTMKQQGFWKNRVLDVAVANSCCDEAR